MLTMAPSHFEIQSFVAKFQQLANDGVNANLNFNCTRGNVFVNFAAELGHLNVQPPPLPAHDHVRNLNMSKSPSFSPNYRRISKPSKIRRRKRRAAERDSSSKETHCEETTTVMNVDAISTQANTTSDI